MSFLEVQNLKMYFPIRSGILKRTTGHVYAVDDISFSVEHGETMGLVGESGCGKSTTARVILRLQQASGGTVTYDGEDVMSASRAQMQRLRRDMQIIFQDPYASLNPRMRVRSIIGEPLKIHHIGTPAERRERVVQLLETVGLTAEHADRYPHEFSGGQRQRIGVARALALNPRLIICDEPVSAQVDLSVHRPRPVGGQAHIRPRGGDVPRQGGGDSRQRRAVRLPAAPVYGGAALGGADPRPADGTHPTAHHTRRRRA
jgi:ABC-type oligopeptide transport system ATPase subunit